MSGSHRRRRCFRRQLPILSLLLSWLISVTLVSCGGEAAPETGLPAATPDAWVAARTADGADAEGPDEEPPAGVAVFDDSKVHTVELTISPSDWQKIIQEAAEYENTNPKRPYYPAQLVFDGAPAGGDIGVRLKGHLSIELSPGHSFPLKLDFDRYQDGLRLDGLKKLNLHTNFDGPSLPIMREYLSYGAWREFGVAAPRAAFTTVKVNGEKLGVYVMVEQVDGGVIKRHFQPPHGDLYKPEQKSGHLEYRGPAISDYPEIGHKWPAQSDHASLLHAVETLANGSATQIEEVFHADGVLTYLAGNVALGSWDCYPTTGHNYYLYELEPGRFTMLPWDMNGSLEAAPHFLTCDPAHGHLSGKLLSQPVGDVRYREILESFVASAASQERLNVRLDAAAQLLGDAVEKEAVEALRKEIAERATLLSEDMAANKSCL